MTTKRTNTPGEGLADFLIGLIESIEADHDRLKAEEQEAFRKLIPKSPPRIELDPEPDVILIQNRFVVMEIQHDATTIIHMVDTWKEFVELKNEITRRGSRFLANI